MLLKLYESRQVFHMLYCVPLFEILLSEMSICANKAMQRIYMAQDYVLSYRQAIANAWIWLGLS